MTTFFRDLRHAFRLLGRNPSFTLVTVLTLALGIGATTAIYSVAYGVPLRPVPYPKPDRIVQVWQLGVERNRMRVADPTFEEWREQTRSFQTLVQYSSWSTTVLGGTVPSRALVATVSRDFFDVMGVRTQLGRSFVKDPSSDAAESGAVISHGFWLRSLGGETNLSALSLRVHDRQLPVLGVIPPGSTFHWARRSGRRVSCGRVSRRAQRTTGVCWAASQKGSPWSRRSPKCRRAFTASPPTRSRAAPARWG